MAEREQKTERVASGPLGKVVGKAKEAIGSTLGNDELSSARWAPPPQQPNPRR